jgi:hypothetical protein
LFGCDQLRLQHVRNLRGDFALDGENVSKLSIVRLGPQMRVGRSVDAARSPAPGRQSVVHCLPRYGQHQVVARSREDCSARS